MTVLQISIPEKKEKAVRILLKELGVTVKKVDVKKPLLKKIKNAVEELNLVKAGKMGARDFDDLLNELQDIIRSFDRDVKTLSKKYPSFKSDLIKLRDILNEDTKSGTPIGYSCYKIRITIASKNKGKSGGARVITNVISINEIEGTVYLLTVYDKSEQENISDSEIKQLLKETLTI